MTLDELIAEVLRDVGHADNPYFVGLRDGSLSRDDFVETQIQFYFAVVFFSRPMAAAAARIPSAGQRLEVLRNVWEEHGEGGRGIPHGESFLTFLHRLAGIGEEEVEARALWPEVRAFNTLLSGACVLDEHLVGVAMLGMIERMFADISGWIGRGIVARGWLTPERMVHYDLHEKLDHKHAADFFDVLRPAWGRGERPRYSIEQGARTGAYAFDALYRGLWNARARRAMRSVRGPHVRT